MQEAAGVVPVSGGGGAAGRGGGGAAIPRALTLGGHQYE